MLRFLCFMLALCCVAFRGERSACAENPTREQRSALIAKIDQLLLSKLEQAGSTPAANSDDAEFLRRVYLDLSGQIPDVSAARDFLASDAENRREQLVEQLLAKPKTFDHLAEVWRNAMLPNASAELLQQATGLQDWLRDKFRSNLRYDRVVSDIVAASGSADEGPALFFTALDLEPKKIASATSRIFLGLQLECAECHDHPFDDWKQGDFWGYAAFFARLPKTNGMAPTANQRLADLASGEVMLPDSDQVVPPKFPRGRHVGEDEPGTRRQQLSIWMASPDNPFLARAAVNRVWALLFGRGLVDPVDDLGPHNPASHPELLDVLTEYFITTGYDLRELLRTLCLTQAYQRTSRVDADRIPPTELFAAMQVKVLSAEQLYDSLRNCLSQNLSDPGMQLPATTRQQDFRRLQFIGQMSSRTGSVFDYDRSLQQALRMMNGQETMGATRKSRSPLLAALEAPFLTDQQRIDILYLATLSRYPSPEEQVRVGHFLTADDKPVDASPWGDILWALINSAEFSLNH